MSKQYQVDNPLQANNSQRLLIGAPLMITLVFCFGFVALNPNKKESTISASAKDDTSKATKPAPLPVMPMAVVAEQTLTTEDTAAPTTNSSNSNSGNTSPQTASVPAATPAASSAKTTSPQSGASSARQTITSKTTVKVTNTAKKLLNR